MIWYDEFGQRKTQEFLIWGSNVQRGVWFVKLAQVSIIFFPDFSEKFSMKMKYFVSGSATSGGELNNFYGGKG